MCVDNDGVFKSQALRHVGMIDLRLPALITLVKGWAKAHDINDPTNRTINSFALTLLVVHHLQQCLPAVLPPLAEILCPDPEVHPGPFNLPTATHGRWFADSATLTASVLSSQLQPSTNSGSHNHHQQEASTHAGSTGGFPQPNPDVGWRVLCVYSHLRASESAGYNSHHDSVRSYLPRGSGRAGFASPN